MRDYTKIIAWQKADDLTVDTYKATKAFPRDEIYALTSQLRRASYSVPANIVEGASRDSKKDYLHFLYTSRGSLNEARYFIHLSRRLGYLSDDQAGSLAQQADEVSRTLSGLIRSVEKETNLISRTAAKLTSFIFLSFGSAVCSLRSDSVDRTAKCEYNNIIMNVKSGLR